MARAISLTGLAATMFVLAILGGSVVGGLYAVRVGADPPLVNPTPEPLSSRDIAMRSFASVVTVATADAKGRPLAFGSGFVIDAGVVITSYHVIKGSTSASAKLIGDSESAPIEGVLAADPSVDLVLLSAPTLRAAPLMLGDSHAAAIGDRVFVVGNPEDLEGTFSEGIISGKRQLEKMRLLQITAPISGGSSGGPVLDTQARVIGVATSSLKGGQNLNFAITGDHVGTLLRAKREL
jgi:S1-C subfamily serine protease